MSALLVAVFAAVGFSGAALFALLGRGASPALQSYATAAAAGSSFLRSTSYTCSNTPVRRQSARRFRTVRPDTPHPLLSSSNASHEQPARKNNTKRMNTRSSGIHARPARPGGRGGRSGRYCATSRHSWRASSVQLMPGACRRAGQSCSKPKALAARCLPKEVSCRSVPVAACCRSPCCWPSSLPPARAGARPRGPRKERGDRQR